MVTLERKGDVKEIKIEELVVQNLERGEVQMLLFLLGADSVCVATLYRWSCLCLGPQWI